MYAWTSRRRTPLAHRRLFGRGEGTMNSPGNPLASIHARTVRGVSPRSLAAAGPDI